MTGNNPQPPSAPQPTPTQPAAPVFQTTVLTPNMVDTLIADDSPPTIGNELWQFFGIDIPVADIKEWDFKNIQDYVDLQFLDMLEEFPEEDWEKVAIIEYGNQEQPELDETGKIICNKDGKPKMILIKVPIKAYSIVKLWDQVRAKTYLKMCRARDGFTLRQLTENRQILEEKLQQTQTMNNDMEQKRKSRWRIV